MFESEKILGKWYWLEEFVQQFSYVTNLDPLKQLAMLPSQINITKPRLSSIEQYILALLGLAKNLANTIFIFHSGFLVEVLFKYDLPGVWDGVSLIKKLRSECITMHLIKKFSKLILWDLNLGNLDYRFSNKDACFQNNWMGL